MARKKTTITLTLKDRVSASLKSIGRSTKKLSKTFLKFGTVVTGVSGYLGAKFFGGAIKSAAEFEEQISILKSVTRATTEELDLMRSAADEAGKNTRFTATEAAQGLEELTRAGLSAKEAVEALNPALNLAQANQIEVAAAATLVTTTLNQYGLAASEAGRVSDVLTRTTQSSATNIEQLGNALEFAGPQARQMGLALEETTALIGKLADQGFRGEKGGTALRNSLIELQTPTSKFNGELSKLGITSKDFTVVLQQLAEKGDASNAALLSLGKRAGPAITALVNGGVSDLDELIKKLKESQGAANDAAREMDDNLPGALKSLGSAFDAFRRTLVDPLLDPIKDQVGELAQKFREFADSDAMPKLQKSLVGVFDNAVLAIQNFFKNFTFEDAVNKASAFASAVAAGFRTIVKVSTEVAGAVSGMASVIGSVVSTTVEWGRQLAILGGLLVAQKIIAWGTAIAGASGKMGLLTAATARFAAVLKTIAWVAAIDLAIKLGVALKGLADVNNTLAETEEGRATAQERIIKRSAEVIEQLKEYADVAIKSGIGIENLNLKQRDSYEAALKSALRFFNVVKLQQQALGNSEGTKAAIAKIQEYQQALDNLSAENTRLAETLSAVGDAAEEGFGKAVEVAGTASDVAGNFTGKLKEFSRDLTENLQRDADNAAQSARNAFESSFAAFEGGTATVEAVRASFIEYATATIQANDGIVDSELKVMATRLGVKDQLDELVAKTDKVVEANNRVAASAENAANKTRRLGIEIRETGDESDDVTKKVVRSAAAVGGTIASAIMSIRSLSEGVAKVVDDFVRSSRTMLPDAYIDKLNRFFDVTKRKFEEQVSVAKMATDEYKRTGNAAQFLARAGQLVGGSFKLLDQATLGRLRAQIDRARAAMRALKQQANDTLRSAQLELLGLQGRQAEVAKLEAEGKIAELDAKIAEASAQGNTAAVSELREAKRLQQQIQQIRVAQAVAAEKEAAAFERAAATQDLQTASNVTPITDNLPAVTSATVAGSQHIILELRAPSGLSAQLGADNESVAAVVIQILAELGLTARTG